MSQKPARKQLEENVQQAVAGAKEEIKGVLLGIALWLYLRLKKKGVLATKGRGEKPV